MASLDELVPSMGTRSVSTPSQKIRRCRLHPGDNMRASHERTKGTG